MRTVTNSRMKSTPTATPPGRTYTTRTEYQLERVDPLTLQRTISSPKTNQSESAAVRERMEFYKALVFVVGLVFWLLFAIAHS